MPMLFHNHFYRGVVLVGVAVAAVCCTSRAAVAATLPTMFTSLEQLDLAGDIRYAINVGGENDFEVCDLTFAAGDGEDSEISGYANSMFADPLTDTTVQPDFGDGEDATCVEGILQTARWDGGGDGAEISLRVVPDTAYKLQLLFCMPRSPRFFDVSIEGQLVIDEFNPAATYTDVAYLYVHEFVAADDWLNIVFTPGSTEAETHHPILNGLTLEKTRATWIPGDADGDGRVNQTDAAILADHWGESVSGWGDGDFNGDHQVDAADASILAANWGYGGSEETGSAVPEPLGLLMVMQAVLLLGLCRRR